MEKENKKFGATPQPTDMINWLIKHGDFKGKSEEDLRKDGGLKIVSSACNIPMEKVVELTLYYLNLGK